MWRSAGKNGSYFLRLPRVSPAERRRDARVVEPRARVDDGRAEVAVDHARVLVEVDAHDHGEAILLGHERAHVRRERLRQHGDRAVRQVDAHAAPLRLDVDGRALAHVVRDVGDGDPQARAAVGQLLDGDGVVEVARRLGIDRRELDVAQIGAVGELGGPHLARQRRRRCARPSSGNSSVTSAQASTFSTSVRGSSGSPRTLSTSASSGPSATSG